MSYTELVKRFWERDHLCPVSPSATRLYFYLVESCRLLAWRQPFGHSDRYIADRLKMSVNTVRSAKEELRQPPHLIDYEVPGKVSRGVEGQTKYTLTVSKIDTVQKGGVSKNDTVQQPTVSKNDTVPGKTVSNFDTNYNTSNSTITNNLAEAGASAGPTVSKIDTVPLETKKEKEGLSAPEKKEPSLYTKCIDIYDGWYRYNAEGNVAKLDGAQGNAMKSIIAHLKRSVKAKNEWFREHNRAMYADPLTTVIIEERVLASWQMIFDNWHLCRGFNQERCRLLDINSEFTNIETSIRNAIKQKTTGGPTTGNGAAVHGKGADINTIQGYKRPTGPNDPQ